MIEAQDAIIRTATVEIQRITIGGKQMTLAAFRQIRPSEDNFDTCIHGATGRLAGTIWGWVRYLVDDALEHIVWQQGAELRRVKRSELAELGRWRKRLLQSYEDSLETSLVALCQRRNIPPDSRITVDGISFSPPSRFVCHRPGAHEWWCYPDTLERHSTDQISDIVQEGMALVNKTRADNEVFFKNYPESMRQINETRQLFIAV